MLCGSSTVPMTVHPERLRQPPRPESGPTDRLRLSKTKFPTLAWICPVSEPSRESPLDRAGATVYFGATLTTPGQGETPMSQTSFEPTSTRTAGIIIVVGTLASVAFMTHHPEVSSRGVQDAIVEIGAEAGLTRLIHGALIVVMGGYLYAFWVFADRLALSGTDTRAGLVAYAIGTAAFIGAALISGFIVTGLAERYTTFPPDAQASFGDLVRLSGIANQALAKLGTLSVSVAIFLWSLALLRRSKLERVAGLIGVVAGLLPFLGILSGRLQLHVKGMTAVVVAFGVWYLLIGVQLIRKRI